MFAVEIFESIDTELVRVHIAHGNGLCSVRRDSPYMLQVRIEYIAATIRDNADTWMSQCHSEDKDRRTTILLSKRHTET